MNRFFIIPYCSNSEIGLKNSIRVGISIPQYWMPMLVGRAPNIPLFIPSPSKLDKDTAVSLLLPLKQFRNFFQTGTNCGYQVVSYS